MADTYLPDEAIVFPPEPFPLVSDVSLDAPGSANSAPSYSIEYSADNGRGGIRHLLADTFKINHTRSYRPSPSSSDVYLPNDYYCGHSVSTDQEEFISIDIQPYITSDVSQNGSTIKNYTTFWSRPEMWRATDGGSELYEVTNIENVKHFRALPFDEVRMYESVWPGTVVVGITTGIIDSTNKRTISNITGLSTFASQPTGAAGIDWVGFTTVYPGDLIHDFNLTPTTTTIIPINTRISTYSPSTITLNKDHTYVGVGATTISFTILRIGPSGINREYGYYFRHYDFEDPDHQYSITGRPSGTGCGNYWQGENQDATGPERYGLDNKFLSEYTYGFYYGKTPDGYYKRVYDIVDDPTLDINGQWPRYGYNSDGRWGVYIDDEVKNYFEGRVLVGHNIGIGTGDANQPEPIVSIFNNKWKNQQDEIDIGSGGNTIGTRVTDPNDFMQFQMGLFVEDLVGIGARIDKRYRLNVDASTTSTGITSTTVTRAARFVGGVDVVGILTATRIGIGITNPTSELYVNGDVFATGIVTATTFVGALTGNVTGNLTGNVTGTASGNKTLGAFDIPHVTQKGKRIRHIIAEGPEPGIYIRGKLIDSNVIELPEYWDGLIDPETITVTLTQIGYSQDLIVDKIEWGKKVIIRSGVGANVNCFYEVWAARWVNPMDHDEKLIVVYDGETPDDYPGDNKQFLVGGWDYDKRNPQWG